MRLAYTFLFQSKKAYKEICRKIYRKAYKRLIYIFLFQIIIDFARFYYKIIIIYKFNQIYSFYY